jgi:cytochrome c
MGDRNPFRIAVDQKNGWLYWGEVGPDSGVTNSARGPVGHDEWNQARSAGNYGWPYFVGNNYAYRDYDFATSNSGSFFNPAAPMNNSPNNTGITNLPPARPAWIWTIRSGTTPQFPELLAGNGRCAMGGPVYHFDPGSSSAKRLPGYYDNTAFIYDWARNYLWEVKLDSNGDTLKINRFLPTFSFTRPHEMELGPDGMLYMIEWGTNFNGDNTDAKVIRIEYMGGNPVPAALSIQSSGPNVVITFPDGAGTLEWANDVKGIWHPVLPPPTSPYVISRDSAMKFYRLRWP